MRDAIAMELRTLGEFTVRNRLLAIEGVSQVSVMGGILKQYQVLTFAGSFWPLAASRSRS